MSSPPPLPPPVRPTHTRTLSNFSGSSSNYSSPSTSPTKPGPGFTAARLAKRNAEKGGTVGVSRSKTYSPSSSPPKPSASTAGVPRANSRSPTLSRSSSRNNNASTSPTISRRTTLSTSSPSASASNPTTPSRPDRSPSTSSLNRTPSLLNKISPALLAKNPARYASSIPIVPSVPPSISELNSAGLGISESDRGFSRGLGQLPSPPATASDGASNGSNLGSLRGGSSVENGLGSGEDHMTPTKQGQQRYSYQVPSIERSSPTGGSPRSNRSTPDKRYSLQSMNSNSSSTRTIVGNGGEESSERRRPPSRLTEEYTPERERGAVTLPSTTRTPRTAPPYVTSYSTSTQSSPDPHGSTGSESEAATLRHEESGRERSDSGPASTSEDSDRKKERRERRARELREKNQRILDNINAGTGVTRPISPPPSQHSSNDNNSSPRRRPDTIRRTSASTMRSLLLSESSASARSSSPSPRVEESSQRALRVRASMAEFGTIASSEREPRRSSTLATPLGDRERERERRVRTIGFGSAERGTGESRYQERPSTSMSSYQDLVGGGNSASKRTSTWLDYERERPRAMSSMGQTTDRDREIARSLRKLSSKEKDMNVTAEGTEKKRERSYSDAAALTRDGGISPNIRQRPGLPAEFVAAAPTRPPRRDHSTARDSQLDYSGSGGYVERKDAEKRTSTSSNGTALESAARRRQSKGESVAWASIEEGMAARERERERDAAATPSSRSRPESWGKGKARRGSIGSSGSGIGGLPYRHNPSNEPPKPTSSSRVRTLSLLTSGTRDGSKSSGEDVFQNGGAPESWLSELQELTRRAPRSKASGSSGDGRSSQGAPAVPINPLDRDRTLRAINAILAGQGIIATAAPSTIGSSSPRPWDGPDSVRRRKSSATESSNYPASTALTRSGSGTSTVYSSRPGTESRMQFNNSSSNEHHKLLTQSLERFESHFTPSEGNEALTPESTDLVKRMTAMVTSTTKLNVGLRALVAASTNAQIEASLDESSRSSTSGMVQFDKSINALLRTSDDQVRSLTEGLIALTRIEREREKLRREGIEPSNRPMSRAASRAGNYPGSPKRPATSSPFEGAVRPLTAAGSTRQTLRDPLEETDLPPRRTTMSFSSRSPRSPWSDQASPTPLQGRRDSAASARSPLSSALSNFESLATPSRASTQGLPVPHSSASSGARSPLLSARRAKSSSTSTATLRPTTPSASNTIHFPRSPASGAADAALDTTNASTQSSPTRNGIASFPRASQRTYSELDRMSYDALGIDTGSSRDGWRHTLSTTRESPSNRAEDYVPTESPTSLAPITNGGSAGRPGRTRLSTGSMGLGHGVGAAIRSMVGIRDRSSTIESVSDALPDSPTLDRSRGHRVQDSVSSSAGTSSPEERRTERRREVEEILNRRVNRGSVG